MARISFYYYWQNRIRLFHYPGSWHIGIPLNFDPNFTIPRCISQQQHVLYFSLFYCSCEYYSKRLFFSLPCLWWAVPIKIKGPVQKKNIVFVGLFFSFSRQNFIASSERWQSASSSSFSPRCYGRLKVMSPILCELKFKFSFYCSRIIKGDVKWMSSARESRCDISLLNEHCRGRWWLCCFSSAAAAAVPWFNLNRKKDKEKAVVLCNLYIFRRSSCCYFCNFSEVWSTRVSLSFSSIVLLSVRPL